MYRSINKNHILLVVHLLLSAMLGSCEAEWSPANCSQSCICHEIWSSQMRAKLRSVDCQDRDLVELDPIPEGTQALLLSGNHVRLDTIRGNLTDIQYLDLSNNQLKVHKTESLRILLTQLPSLKALDLSNNYLESLLSSLFTTSTTLEFLSLSGNSIVYIERNTFQPLTNIKTLHLHDNQLERIDENWFSNSSSNLRLLTLNKNRITDLQANDLRTFKHLERLELSFNKISIINDNAFIDSSIRELFMNNNQLTSVPTEALSKMLLLTNLHMDGNLFQNLSANSFNRLPSLVFLSLSNLPFIKEIKRAAFFDLPNLKKVDLYDNKDLQFIDKEAFINCTNLAYLFLHGNNLRGLDKGILEHVPKLDQLSFYNNPVHCNCHINWILRSNLTLIDGDKIVCETPHSVKQATLASLKESQLVSDCTPFIIGMAPQQKNEFGSDITLSCQAIGAKSLNWSVRTLPNFVEENLTSINGDLKLNHIRHSDEGMYTCLALSENGESDSQSVLIHVTHAPIVLVATSVSQNFVTLSWNETRDATLLSYTEPGGRTTQISYPDYVTACTLTDLTSNATYVICLRYHNVESSCVSVTTLPMTRNDLISSDSQGQSGKIVQISVIVLITVTSFIVIVVALFLIYKRLQRYRHMRIKYCRQENESNLESSTHLKQCYNPTTEPFINHDFT